MADTSWVHAVVSTGDGVLRCACVSVFAGGYFLAQAYQAAFPKAKYMKKPRLVTQTAFLCVVRHAYDGFRRDLMNAVKAQQQAATAERDANGRHHKALTALKNLWELMEEDIPVVHDYFSYLKVSDVWM